ncbi:MAG: pyruvate:ferredoxin (flavodoxin) oxidoreductase [Lachnoclostridium sp.]|nr:pyruvate:ferredoxin (flavodoxin) oxidoreductase [Lachnoclostridium sp.]
MAQKQILDGCTAAAHVAFALSEVATIYPITPIASMGDTAMKWGLGGRVNIFGQPLQVRELESELGAAGALHGALAAGALGTTFTASQGLMLMIPNLFKIAGELLPGVIHAGCRTVASHALSIFGDHQDVMACRATGVALLASSSVQETMDLAVVAHIASVKGRVPVIHFFDGWRTSSEMDTISVIDYDEMKPLMDMDAVNAFRARALNPEHPTLRGSCQQGDVFFQNREASNIYYDAFPAIVQEAMDKVAAITGRQYHLADWHGADDAEEAIIIMASGAAVVSEAVDYLNARGRKTGVLNVHLYRPFPAEQILAALPSTVKRIAVLDRTKEPGAAHEPLCLDIMAAVQESGRQIKVIGGRYGLSSKQFTPSMAAAVFDELQAENPRSVFTVGINDDVTHLSLDCSTHIVTPEAAGSLQAIFYGIGADGTVGATKQAATIIGNSSDLYAQAYFSYSAKKSGGYTVSELRINREPVTSAYSIENADYIGCHHAPYVDRFDMLARAKDGAKMVINAPWTADDIASHLPANVRRDIARKKIKLYTIDANAIAQRHGLGSRINMPMEIVFLKLTEPIPFDQAYDALRNQIRLTYIHEGEDVVQANYDAIADACSAIVEIKYPADWADATDDPVAAATEPEFVSKILRPCLRRQGDSIPVSAFTADGTMPMGTTAYEHRRIATHIPVWDSSKCIECTRCSFVCPHAAIRPFVLDAAEKANVPDGFVTKKVFNIPQLKGMDFRIQVYGDDCLGCGNCAMICPGKALTMTPVEGIRQQQAQLAQWAGENISSKSGLVDCGTVVGSQLRTPGLQFSGACAGCGETPVVKLLTQLLGPSLMIANATGCSSVWGADYPSNPYCTVTPDGRGPAWGNSLFEDNAEYGLGMLDAVNQRRELLRKVAQEYVSSPDSIEYLHAPIQAWLSAFDDTEMSRQTADMLLKELTPFKGRDPRLDVLIDGGDMLACRTVWAVGGDGWAYDIGFAGLDHALASGQRIRILVLDTECYSNTGGQTSKATPRSAIAKYNPAGKPTPKKELAAMMMTHPDVYVASIAIGADYQQAVNAILEADRNDGPSIVIAYCPCINHNIVKGMSHATIEENRAVRSGYWPLFRRNPADGGSLTIDYRPGQSPDDPDIYSFTQGENRYRYLSTAYPLRADTLRPLLATDCNKFNSLIDYLKLYGAI